MSGAGTSKEASHLSVPARTRGSLLEKFQASLGGLRIIVLGFWGGALTGRAL